MIHLILPGRPQTVPEQRTPSHMSGHAPCNTFTGSFPRYEMRFSTAHISYFSSVYSTVLFIFLSFIRRFSTARMSLLISWITWKPENSAKVPIHRNMENVSKAPGRIYYLGVIWAALLNTLSDGIISDHLLPPYAICSRRWHHLFSLYLSPFWDSCYSILHSFDIVLQTSFSSLTIPVTSKSLRFLSVWLYRFRFSGHLAQLIFCFSTFLLFCRSYHPARYIVKINANPRFCAFIIGPPIVSVAV